MLAQFSDTDAAGSVLVLAVLISIGGFVFTLWWMLSVKSDLAGIRRATEHHAYDFDDDDEYDEDEDDEEADVDGERDPSDLLRDREVPQAQSPPRTPGPQVASYPPPMGMSMSPPRNVVPPQGQPGPPSGAEQGRPADTDEPGRRGAADLLEHMCQLGELHGEGALTDDEFRKDEGGVARGYQHAAGRTHRAGWRPLVQGRGRYGAVA